MVYYFGSPHYAQCYARNWQNGCCNFAADRCSFAHGKELLGAAVPLNLLDLWVISQLRRVHWHGYPRLSIVISTALCIIIFPAPPSKGEKHQCGRSEECPSCVSTLECISTIVLPNSNYLHLLYQSTCQSAGPGGCTSHLTQWFIRRLYLIPLRLCVFPSVLQSLSKTICSCPSCSCFRSCFLPA